MCFLQILLIVNRTGEVRFCREGKERKGREGGSQKDGERKRERAMEGERGREGSSLKDIFLKKNIYV